VQKTELPLFPLNSVVFPGGSVPLRIFEQRYLDMVRDCARTDSGFGICLILKDPGDGLPVKHANIGTLVRISDWFTHDDGLLGIMGRGGRRFRVISTEIQADGLGLAQVEWIMPEPPAPLPVEYSVLSAIVARYMEQAQEHFPDFQPDDLNNAVFVGYRLAELLPLNMDEKQKLLEISDPLRRLKLLQKALPRFQGD